jgi:hypothetical protein
MSKFFGPGDGRLERGAHPHDVLLREAELIGHGVRDGCFEALARRRVVVHTYGS